MNATEPIRPETTSLLAEVEQIIRERLGSLEQDRAAARPADEVFRRVLHPAS